MARARSHSLMTFRLKNPTSDRSPRTSPRVASLLPFALFGLVGPTTRLATWPSNGGEFWRSRAVKRVIYDLVLYIWPTQPLGAFEHAFGWWPTLLLATGSNVLLFAALGLGVAAAHTRGVSLVLVYATTCIAMLSVSVSTGGELGLSSGVPALALALLLLAVPFLIVGNRWRESVGGTDRSA
jgi:hypothetical protein